MKRFEAGLDAGSAGNSEATGEPLLLEPIPAFVVVLERYCWTE